MVFDWCCDSETVFLGKVGKGLVEGEGAFTFFEVASDGLVLEPAFQIFGLAMIEVLALTEGTLLQLRNTGVTEEVATG